MMKLSYFRMSIHIIPISKLRATALKGVVTLFFPQKRQ